ncbi:RNA-binding (RRM/RBD/RNP motifs) family protein [Euphorbia peplus]|nr:RNA-binding (RRM/RBD/RNP motifs) family protein [Euphorbia peplus]
MSVRTVKVSNVSLGATERDLKEFFSFSGDIEYVEVQRHNDISQTAYVTFKDSQGAETAVLLTGATIVDLSVNITLDPDYQLPPEALAPAGKDDKSPDSALRKAEDVVSGMLAKGFILGKDAVNKAKTFDEKHQLTSTASAKVVSFDKKIGLTDKISAGTIIVGDKVREVDQKFQVSEKTKSAFSAAEQKVSDAGNAIMKNRYVFTSATWVTGAFNKVAKAAGEVGQKAKEKVGMAEEEQKRKMVDDFAEAHLSESPKGSHESDHTPKKPPPAQVVFHEFTGAMAWKDKSRSKPSKANQVISWLSVMYPKSVIILADS